MPELASVPWTFLPELASVPWSFVPELASVPCSSLSTFPCSSSLPQRWFWPQPIPKFVGPCSPLCTHS
ncbi:hypothetical protein HYD99_03930 [Mycoplasmopsis bovis]|nr:hypothetical protein [Mycoplasmopsis bovis]QQH29056.1 hypothetical protein HYD99_03930 [Mycoplasmopsis bovis]